MTQPKTVVLSARLRKEGKESRSRVRGRREKSQQETASTEIQLSCPAVWREPRTPAQTQLAAEWKENRSVACLLTFEWTEKQTTLGTCRACMWQVQQQWVYRGCKSGEPGPHPDISVCSVSAAPHLLLQHCPGSSFLCFALKCYRSFYGWTGWESTLCMVQSICNTSGGSFNGTVNKSGSLFGNIL